MGNLVLDKKLKEIINNKNISSNTIIIENKEFQTKSLIKFINNNIDKKIIIIANKDFDFNRLYTDTNMVSIDSIIPYGSPEYIIILQNH